MNTETNTKVTKRDYGDGSISYIESKKLWEARLSYGKAGNGNRDRRSRYAKTKPDARKLLKKMIIERDAAINFNAQLYLMKDYYEIWLNEKKGQIKENSYIRIRQVVETYILPEIGYMQLGIVNDVDIIRIMNDLAVKNLSLSTRKKVYDALNACFRWAVEKNHILYSPLRGMKKPSENSDSIPEATEMMPFTEDEYIRFVKESKRCHGNGSPVYRLGWLFIFMLSTGIRIGEAQALQWCSIDLDENEVHIWQTTAITEDEIDGSRKQGTKVKNRTKSHAGNRKLKLNFTALEALTELHKITGKFKRVASTKSGTIVSHRNILRTFHCILEKANLEKRGVHNTRHTFASHLFKRKVELIVISKLLGHSSTKVTEKVYIHFIEEHKRDAIYALDYISKVKGAEFTPEEQKLPLKP